MIVEHDINHAYAPIAQLDRAFDYGSKGCGFDSYWARHYRDVAQLGSALDLGSRGRRFKSCHPDHLINGPVAQSVEQRTENPCVVGSIPTGTTIYKNLQVRLCICFFLYIYRNGSSQKRSITLS